MDKQTMIIICIAALAFALFLVRMVYRAYWRLQFIKIFGSLFESEEALAGHGNLTPAVIRDVFGVLGEMRIEAECSALLYSAARDVLRAVPSRRVTRTVIDALDDIGQSRAVYIRARRAAIARGIL